jgi:hypothetical protein
MGNIDTLTGVVSNLNVRSNAIVSVLEGMGLIIHQSSFRIGNKPVRYNGTAHFSNGDNVTVVGKDSNEFKAYVLRNNSTGVAYRAMVVIYIVNAIIMLIPSYFCFSWLGVVITNSAPDDSGAVKFFTIILLALSVFFVGLTLLFFLSWLKMNKVNQTLINAK